MAVKKAVKLHSNKGFLVLFTMTEEKRISQLRRLSEVSTERRRSLDGLERSLLDTKRVANVLCREFGSHSLGIDFSNLGNIRVTDEKIVLFVRNSLQKSKLRQILPRLESVTQAAGFIKPIEISVRPTGESPLSSIVESEAPRREGNTEAANYMKGKADTLLDGPVKEALLSLAKTLKSESQ